MTLALLPKPERFFIVGRWILRKNCGCGSGCRGHILALTPFYVSGEKIDIHRIDIYQWNKAIEQEFLAYEELVNPLNPKNKKLYTPKPKPEQKTGGSSGKGFGPRH